MSKNNVMPPAFPYLRTVLDRLALESFGSIEDRQVWVDNLSPDDRETLIQAYKRIAEVGDDVKISEWIQDESLEDQFAERALGYQLFLIFEILQTRGIDPFSSGFVRFVPTVPRFDWNVLPESLRYLGPMAAKYGRYQFPDDVEIGIARLKESDIEELAAIGRIMTDAEVLDLNAFLGSHRLTESKEVEYLYYFLEFLSAASESGKLP